ncbi:MAG TPA: dNTP triphosphohydrolase [Longimicrobiaceae bacterium]|nr:dNTP triphosphohydrolase [Longimicrobiaceae bacterium]
MVTMAASTWKQLVSSKRLRPSSEPTRGDDGNEFLSDYYRVVFSSSFRRLQDKTQVSPLASTDYVRRRLTHSVEVAVVGERMGRVLARRLQAQFAGEDLRDDFGKIVATACLLHDIGNPPFGHEGEMAIRSWADRSCVDCADYRCFDGNAQGFRIAVRLQHQGKAYGLNLTAATLSTMLKYPVVPVFDARKVPAPALRNRGKWSVMASEQHQYEAVRELVGLADGQRHPLSYVVEAADDIVNRLVDIEDAIKLKLVSYSDVCDTLRDLKEARANKLLDAMEDQRKAMTVGTAGERELWAYQTFRVNATTGLAQACEQVFEENVEALKNGTFTGELVAKCEFSGIYNAIKKLENERIFGDAGIVRVEAGGKAAIEGLLTIFSQEVEQRSKLADTVPEFPTHEQDAAPDPHANVRRVVDYVSGMTDRFAISLYQELSGMSL